MRAPHAGSRVAATAVIAFGLALPATAQQAQVQTQAQTPAVAGEDETAIEHWRIDPGASSARFRVRLFGVVPISGWFDRLEGEVRVDRARGVATVTAALDANAVRMNRESNTEWAKSPEFFDAAKHPEIRFVSIELPLERLTEGGHIDGTLALRGITGRVAFALDDTDCSLDVDSTCRVVVSGSVDRSQFGMTTRRGTVAERVGFTLKLVAERS